MSNRLTADQLARFAGRTGMFKVPIRSSEPNGFRVPVRVLDARQSYGRTDLKIEPEGGEGAAWVSHESVKLKEDGL